MKIAKFQYKCRLCGEIYADVCTSEENAFMVLVHIVLDKQMPSMMGVQPKMIEVHASCKAGHGIADLMGTITVEE